MLKTKRSTRFFIVLVHLIGNNYRISLFQRQRTTTTSHDDETIIIQLINTDEKGNYTNTNTNSKKRIRNRIYTSSLTSTGTSSGGNGNGFGYIVSILPEWFRTSTTTVIGVQKRQEQRQSRKHKPRIVIESIDLYNYYHYHYQNQNQNQNKDHDILEQDDYDDYDNNDNTDENNCKNNNNRNQFIITPGIGVDAYEQYHYDHHTTASATTAKTSRTTIPSKKERHRTDDSSCNSSTGSSCNIVTSSTATTSTTMFVWLQLQSLSQLQSTKNDIDFDKTSSLCLNLNGYFSQCGDTTLWEISSILLQPALDRNNNNNNNINPTTEQNEYQQRHQQQIQSPRSWKHFIRDTLSDATITNQNHNQNVRIELKKTDSLNSVNDIIQTPSTKRPTTFSKENYFGWTFQVIQDDIYNRMLQNHYQQQQKQRQHYHSHHYHHHPSQSVSSPTSTPTVLSTTMSSTGSSSSNDNIIHDTECLQYNIPTSNSISAPPATAEIDVSVRARINNNHQNKIKSKRRRNTVAPLPFALPTSILMSNNNVNDNINLNMNNNNVWYVNANRNLQIVEGQQQQSSSLQSSLCLGRHLVTSQAVLIPCIQDDDTMTSTMQLVQFSFIQYRLATTLKNKNNSHNKKTSSSSSSSNDVLRNRQQDKSTRNQQSVGKPQQQQQQQQRRRRQRRKVTEQDDDSSNLPHNREYASIRSNADVHTLNPTLALAKRIRYDNLYNSNPILFVSASASSSASGDGRSSVTPSSSSSKPPTSAMNYVMSMRPSSSNNHRRNSMMMMSSTASPSSTGRIYPSNNRPSSNPSSRTKDEHKQGDNSHKDTIPSSPIMASSPSASVSSLSENAAGKIQHHRIYRHPYIDSASKDNIWTDPQTGLEYHTDLTNYLQFDKQEYGRHTLTGVGVYRKGYVIKVYGVAFYVSKRDVLADPSFLQYTGMSATELRNRPDFYQLLRTMGNDSPSGTINPVDDDPNNNNNSNNNNVGRFDRTIVLKTNMQLAAETMRSSLQADWSYLTEEMKLALLGSSMVELPADDKMMQLIKSPDNPSRCSCCQLAPSEYNGNPDCCARGTELSFTWLKNDYLQVRLNGRLMASFPRPDIAKGIFFEYLRLDDPMSPEFRDRVVDGFPFLLSPLSQVKGIQQQMASQSSTDTANAGTGGSITSNPSFVERIGDTMSYMQQQIVGATTSAKHTMTDTSSAVFKGFIDNSKWVASTAESKRKWLADQIVATPTTIVKIIRNDEETMREISNFRKSIIIESDKSRQWMIDSIISVPKTIMSTIDASKSVLEHIPFLPSSKSVTVEGNDTIPNDDNDIIGDADNTDSSDIEDIDYWSDIEWDEFLLDPMFDEIGGSFYHSVDNDITTPITNSEYLRQFFVSLGHLYLLLMFIVSFPGSSYSTHESSSASSSSSVQTVISKTSNKRQTSSFSAKIVRAEGKTKDASVNLLLDSHRLRLYSSDSFHDEIHDEQGTATNRNDGTTSKSKNRLSRISSITMSPRSRQTKKLLNPFDQTQTKRKKRKKRKKAITTGGTHMDDPSDSSSTPPDGSLSPHIHTNTISSIMRAKAKSIVGRAAQSMLPKLIESNHSQSVDNGHLSLTGSNHSGKIVHCETIDTVRCIHSEPDDSSIQLMSNDVHSVQTQNQQCFQ